MLESLAKLLKETLFLGPTPQFSDLFGVGAVWALIFLRGILSNSKEQTGSH